MWSLVAGGVLSDVSRGSWPSLLAFSACDTGTVSDSFSTATGLEIGRTLTEPVAGFRTVKPPPDGPDGPGVRVLLLGRVLLLRNVRDNFCMMGKFNARSLRLSADLALSRSLRTMSLNRVSKACFRASTVHIETQIELPSMIKIHSKTCWNVVISLRLTYPTSIMSEESTSHCS